jgi:hypothetical protein
MRVKLIFVMLLVAGSLLVPAAAAEQRVPYVEVSVDKPIGQTYDKTIISFYSEIPEFNQTTGNYTLIPSYNTVVVNVYDVNHNVIILEKAVPLFNGSGYIVMFVEPAWTSTYLNITVIDGASRLIGYANLRTEMSDAYLVWYIDAQHAKRFIDFSNSERERADAAITQSRFLTIAVAMCATLILILLLMKKEHTEARMKGAPSVYDRFVHRVFPYSFVPDDAWVWLDEKHSWDPSAARLALKHRRQAHVAWLLEQRDELENEIHKSTVAITDSEMRSSVAPIKKANRMQRKEPESESA